MTFRKCLILAIVCFHPLISAYSQDVFKGFYLNPKLGKFNWRGDVPGTISELEIGYIKDKTVYSLAGTVRERLYPTPAPLHISSLSVKYGKIFGPKNFKFNVQGGLSFGISSFSSPDVNTKLIGIPLQTGIKIIPLKYLAIGFKIQGNLNLNQKSFNYHSYYAYLFSIQIGRLR